MENDHGKQKKQFNCRARIGKVGIEAHHLLCIKAGIMTEVQNEC